MATLFNFTKISTFFLSYLLFSSHLLASEEKLINQTKIQNLAAHPQWKALLHYTIQLFSPTQSEADNPGFFLSDSGSSAPKIELEETIKQWFINPNFYCQFPARYHWIGKNIGYDFSQKAYCPKLSRWKKSLASEHISLIFASSYLENPSSMYGHTFLRFYDSADPTTALTTSTINFAANTGDKTGHMDFIFRGLFGGFPGVADNLPFYRKLRTYTDNEGRDLWEYTLKLSAEDIHLIQLHIWEIRENTFDYFFIDENCSYRILAILAVANPDLRPPKKFSGYAIPFDTVNEVIDNDLVTEINHWPSTTKRLYQHATSLNNEHKILARDFAKSNSLKLQKRIDSLPPIIRSNVLSVSYEYLSLLINRDLIARPFGKQHIQRIIALRSKLPRPHNNKRNSTTSASPDQGHPSARSSLSLGHNQKGDFIGVTLRGAYHSTTDPIAGFTPGATVEALNFKIKIYENSTTEFSRFDLVNIQSRPISTPFFSPTAWDLNLSRSRKPIKGKPQLINTAAYKRGKSYSFSGITLTQLLGASLDYNHEFNNGDNLGLEVSIKAEALKQQKTMSYMINYEHGTYISGTQSTRREFNFLTTYTYTKQQQASLNLEYWKNSGNTDTTLQIGYQYFF